MQQWSSRRSRTSGCLAVDRGSWIKGRGPVKGHSQVRRAGHGSEVLARCSKERDSQREEREGSSGPCEDRKLSGGEWRHRGGRGAGVAKVQACSGVRGWLKQKSSSAEVPPQCSKDSQREEREKSSSLYEDRRKPATEWRQRCVEVAWRKSSWWGRGHVYMQINLTSDVFGCFYSKTSYFLKSRISHTSL